MFLYYSLHGQKLIYVVLESNEIPNLFYGIANSSQIDYSVFVFLNLQRYNQF